MVDNNLCNHIKELEKEFIERGYNSQLLDLHLLDLLDVQHYQLFQKRNPSLPIKKNYLPRSTKKKKKKKERKESSNLIYSTESQRNP